MVDLKIRDFVINDIEAVLFDKDGTLMDANIWWCEIIKRRAWAIVSKYHLLFEDAHDIMFRMGWREGNKLSSSGPVGLMGRKEVIWHVRQYLRTRYELVVPSTDLEQLFDGIHSDFLRERHTFMKPLPGAIDLIKNLHAHRVKVAIITNDTAVNTEAFLHDFGITNAVDLVLGQENMSSAKDTGDPARRVLQMLNVSFDRAIVIGDAPIDIRMAINCPVAAGIAVATGQTGAQDLIRFTPYVISSLSEISINKELV